METSMLSIFLIIVILVYLLTLETAVYKEYSIIISLKNINYNNSDYNYFKEVLV